MSSTHTPVVAAAAPRPLIRGLPGLPGRRVGGVDLRTLNAALIAQYPTTEEEDRSWCRVGAMWQDPGAGASLMEVGLQDVLREIVQPGGEPAAATLAKWEGRVAKHPMYADIIPFVKGFTHRVLPRLTVAEVERITSHPDASIRTEHALSNIRQRECPKEVDDFDTPWTYNYMLHDFLERQGRLFRWGEFWSWFKGEAADRYFVPYKEAFGWDKANAAGRVALERALQWRVGRAYYSFLREIDLLTRLREIHGLNVRYHLLADVNFRVDLWVEGTLVLLYLRNSTYRDEFGGRKQKVADLIDLSRFRYLEIGINAPTAFGKPSLVDQASVEAVAAAIKAQGNG